MTYPNPDVQFSYGYQELVRDVSPLLVMILASMPQFISLVGTANYRAMQHKHNWAEDVHTPEQTTITAQAAANATTLTVASKAPFKLNAIVRIDGLDEILRVTAISAVANEITVVRAYGETTAAIIPKDKKLVVVSKPKLEASNPDLTSDKQAPTMNFNYTEIYDDEAVVPKSQGSIYGVGSPTANDPVGAMLDYRVTNALRQILRRMNSSLIYGRRVEKTESLPGTMGGLLYYMRNGNKVAAAGEQISEKLFGDAFQKALDGGASTVDTILCSATQARNISRVYNAKLQIQRTDQTLGATIYRVQSEIPIKGFTGEIAVDPNFPESKIWLGNRSDVLIVPHRPMKDEDSAPKGADYVARRILGEYTTEFNGIDKKATLIEGLSTVLIA